MIIFTALRKIFYTPKLNRKTVCDLEKKLIAIYKRNGGYLCMNQIGSYDSCITNEHGIVYLSIYDYALCVEQTLYASWTLCIYRLSMYCIQLLSFLLA